MATCRIQLLGPLRVERDGEALSGCPSRKAESLLCCLAYHHPTKLDRDRLLALLWPDEPAALVRNRLNTELNRLRHWLEPAGVERDTYLHAWRQPRIGLREERVTIDVAIWRKTLEAAWGAAEMDHRRQLLRLSLRQCQQPLLPDSAHPWLAAAGRELLDERARAVLELVRLELRAGHREAAAEPLVEALALDPGHEAMGRRLLELLLDQGRRAEAESWALRLLDGSPNGPSAALRATLRRLRSEDDGVSEPPVETGSERLLERAEASLAERDWAGALVWYAEAMATSPTERRDLAELRLQLTLRLCPELVEIWRVGTPLALFAAAAEGRRMVAIPTGGPPLMRCGDQITELDGGRRGSRVHAALVPPNGNGFALADTAAQVKLYRPDGDGFGCETLSGGLLLQSRADQGWVTVPDAAGRVQVVCVAEPERRYLVEPEAPCRIAEVSRDGRWLLLVDVERRLHGYRLNDAAERVWTQTSEVEPRQVVLDPTGRYLAEAGDQPSLRLRRVLDGGPIGEPLLLSRPGNALAFSPQGTWLAVGSGDGVVRLARSETGREVAPSVEVGTDPQKLTFDRQERLLVVANRRGEIRILDCPELKLRVCLPAGAPVVGLGLMSNGEALLAGSQDGLVRRWDLRRLLRSAAMLTLEHADGCHLAQIRFSPDGGRLSSAGGDGTARLWDLDRGELARAPLRHEATVWRAVYSHSGAWLATASKDGTARVWDSATGEPVSDPLPHEDQVRDLAFSPDDRWLATACPSGVGAVWELPSGRRSAPDLDHLFRGPSRLAFHPTQPRLVAVGGDGSVACWGLPDLRLLWLQPHLNGTGHGCEFVSPDLLLVHAMDPRALVLDPREGTVRLSVQTSNNLHAMAMDPSHRHLATASIDGVVRLWCAETGRPTSPPLVHDDWALCVGFSPCGRILVSGSNDGTARLWEVPSGRAIGPPLPHPSYIFDARFHPTRPLLATACSDGRIRLWNLASTSRSPSDWHRLAHRLSGREIDGTGSLMPLSADRWQELETEPVGG